jgi:hypothetical protein
VIKALLSFTLAAVLAAMLAFRPRKDNSIFRRNPFIAQTQILLATDHAGLAREAFISASDLFADLADKLSPDQRDQARRLRQAAQAIDPNRLLLDQKSQVREFFTRASAALQAMSQVDNGAKTSINTSRL